MSSPTDDAATLGDLLAALSRDWPQIEHTAQALANSLRTKGDTDYHTQLGKSLLPQNLTSLLNQAGNTSIDADSSRALAIYELLRVGANLCVDHNGNREALLDAGFVRAVLSLLEREVDSIPAGSSTPLPLSIPHLKVIKTAIGVLLNASVGYDPVKFRLISLEAPHTILRLSTAIYPPGSWLTSPLNPDLPQDEILESWTLRSGLSAWAWLAISELKEDTETEEAPSRSPMVQALLGPNALPLLVLPLKAFIPPAPTPPPLFADPSETRKTLVQTDFDALEEVCMLLESLCLDVEDVRLALARGLASPAEHEGVRCLEQILDFVERGDYSPFWSDEDRPRRTKAFDMCKAALIKAVVEVAGEEKNVEVLWEESAAGGAFVERMVKWIRKERAREDLVICATLALGNMVRREAHSLVIIKPPNALAPELVAFLDPATDIKVKHGVLGLLKNLAVTPLNRPALAETGLIQKLATSEVLSDKFDMAEVVQGSAIGLAKHMCNGNIDATFTLVLPDESGDGSKTALSQILAVVQRSDTIAIKSEGTRVLVNVIKSIWSSDAAAHGDKRKAAMREILKPDCAMALAQLLSRSKKYAILVNEGVVALSLLSTHTEGGALVVDAITAPLPREAGQGTRSGASSVPASAASEVASPTSGPPCALNMLAYALANRDGQFPPEVRANVCALLAQLWRAPAGGREVELLRVRNATRELVEAAAEAEGEKSVLGAAARRVLEAWKQ